MNSFSKFVQEQEEKRRPWLFHPQIQKTRGKGRGHWGHKGRPGKVGGSVPNSEPQVKLHLLWDMEKRSPKAAAGVKEMVGRLPHKHQEIVSKWKLEAMRSGAGPEEADVAKKGSFMPFLVNPKTKTLSAMRGDWANKNPIIFHEMGHLIFDAEQKLSLSSWTKDLAGQMKGLVGRVHERKGQRLSQKRRLAEAFSDAYELYFSNRGKLPKDVLQFLDTVMEEAE